MFLSDTSVKRPVLATMLSLAIVLFGAIGYAAACIMGVTLLRDIRYSERSPEDR